MHVYSCSDSSNRPCKVYQPVSPLPIYSSKLLSEEAAYTKSSKGLQAKGSVLVETRSNGMLEVYLLVDPHSIKQDLEDSIKPPRYMLVVFDEEESDKSKKTIKDITEYARVFESSDKWSQISIGVVDNKGNDLKVKVVSSTAAKADLNESQNSDYQNINNDEDLNLQVKVDQSDAKRRRTRAARQANEEKTPIKTMIKNNTATDSVGLSSNKSKKQSTGSTPSLNIRPSLAKLTLDMAGNGGNPPSQFIGIAVDRSRSPRQYKKQLMELNDKAARTIQLYWLYCCRKPETRAHFLKKFSKARSTLGSDGLFRKFLLHFVSLPGNEPLDKALRIYVNLLRNSDS